MKNGEVEVEVEVEVVQLQCSDGVVKNSEVEVCITTSTVLYNTVYTMLPAGSRLPGGEVPGSGGRRGTPTSRETRPGALCIRWFALSSSLM